METAEGRGTCFDVHLPRAAGAPLALHPTPPPRRAVASGETLLVVEDDPSSGA